MHLVETTVKPKEMRGPMKGNKTLNMTQGNPGWLLITFAIPLLIGNVFQQAYNMADSIIVGQFLGSSALAAVGATGSTGFLFFSLCGGISGGCGVVASQMFGSGDFKRTQKTIANAAYIMMFFSIVVAVAAYFFAPGLLRLLGTPVDILPDSIAYLKMTCIGVPLVAVYNYSSSMLRALGDSRTPLYFLIFASVLNVALDLFCICVLHMGVFGAALATVIAQVVAGVGCLLYALKTNPYFHLKRADFELDWGIVKRSIRIGLPMAMQWSLIAISSTALQAFINTFGANAVAAFTAVGRIEAFVHMPYGSVNAALSTYAGQNYGANDMKRVKDGFRYGMLMTSLFSVLMMVCYMAFSETMMRLFVQEPEVIAIGAGGLRLTSWFYIFLAVIYMCRGILNGIGDALFALINGVVEVVCRVGLPALLMLIPGIGVDSIWWATGLTWAFAALSCWFRYCTWKKKIAS